MAATYCAGHYRADPLNWIWNTFDHWVKRLNQIVRLSCFGTYPRWANSTWRGCTTFSFVYVWFCKSFISTQCIQWSWFLTCCFTIMFCFLFSQSGGTTLKSWDRIVLVCFDALYIRELNMIMTSHTWFHFLQTAYTNVCIRHLLYV